MDPGSALTVLSNDPILIENAAAEMRGAFLPLGIPLATLTPAQRAAWLLPRSDIEVEVRVRAALEAGLAEQAWKLVVNQTDPLVGRVDLVLGLWGARELARLGLPGYERSVLIVADRPPAGLEQDARVAMSASRETLSSLPWPRWSGPLLLVVGEHPAHDPAPGRDEVVRPVLPVLRYGAPPAGVTPAEHLAARLCSLTLDLTAPPAGGWPAWLRTGLKEVAMAKVRGEGPSPLKMLAIRQHAGKQALQLLFTAERPDPQLALALCAPLVHTRRRPLLPNLLELLRHGAEPEGALHVAYDLTLDRLLEER